MRYVYLHGFASGPLSRKAQFFREKFESTGVPLEIPALDQGDFEHLTITSQLDFITRLLDGQPAVLLGSSMGGYLAALYASQHPEIERMVLLAPAFGFGLAGPRPSARIRLRNGAHAAMQRSITMPRGICAGCRSTCSTIRARHPGYPLCRQPALVFHGSTITWFHCPRRKPGFGKHAGPTGPCGIRPRTARRPGVALGTLDPLPAARCHRIKSVRLGETICDGR